MSKLVSTVGFSLICIGVSCGDSECLLIPFGIMITGALLLHIGTRDI